MVNDLTDLMRASAADTPSDEVDVATVLATGRRRARTRRTLVGAGVATLAAAAVVGTAVLAGGSRDPDVAGQRRSAPPVEGPVVRLDDARAAVEGTDYDLLTTYEVKDLESEPSTHVTGVTDDRKLVLTETNTVLPARVTLLDPTTGGRDELPPAPVYDPVEASATRLVFDDLSPGERTVTAVRVFDRTARTWSRISWPGLPEHLVDHTEAIGVGPDDRLYLALRREYEPVPPELWSVSLTDPDDVRDEGMRADSVDLTDGVLTWTDSDKAPTGALHVRDLATGEQTDLDVPGGEACDVIIDRAGDLIALTERCGDDDDRIVVLDATGAPLATIPGTSFGKAWIVGSGVVVPAGGEHRGTYVYDADTGDLLRLDREDPRWGEIEPTPDGLLLWSTTSGRPNDYGAIFHLARWLD